MKNWHKYKEYTPERDRLGDKVSKRVLVVMQDSTEVNGYAIRFAVFNYPIRTWLIEGCNNEMSKYVRYWAYVPEFTGEMKNHLKKIRNGKV